MAASYLQNGNSVHTVWEQWLTKTPISRAPTFTADVDTCACNRFAIAMCSDFIYSYVPYIQEYSPCARICVAVVGCTVLRTRSSAILQIMLHLGSDEGLRLWCVTP